ncbi:MAG: FAD-dependent oxidoreductase [Planctomycetota bacterium]|nr:FAD-dependent oxidoreductase [Planctomycetota bacterium]
MPVGEVISVDVVIFGGGGAGLWLLDTLHRAGHRALLLEAGELGAGQTVASQGIVHGGVKYALDGLLSPSARAVREMPLLWRRCLAGEDEPDLSATRRRAEFCHLWQTGTLSSRVAMFGARAGLRVRPVPLEPQERPGLLRDCPGVVARLDEQVIDPESFVRSLADRNEGRVFRIDAGHGVEFDREAPGEVDHVHLINPETGEPLNLKPHRTVFTAGAGSARLREAVGLPARRIQRRPLHMVLARGDLPPLNGHCVDGMHTRVTITTTEDTMGRAIWQIGGQVAEDGVNMERADLIRHARAELNAVLPGLDMTSAEWATYRVDRAELATRSGRRPTDARVVEEGRVISAAPTKMVLIPQLVRRVMDLLPAPAAPAPAAPLRARLDAWPRPDVAIPPWEEDLAWSIGV